MSDMLRTKKIMIVYNLLLWHVIGKLQ